MNIGTDRRFQPNEATKAQNVGLPIPTIRCFAVQNERVLLRGAVGELGISTASAEPFRPAYHDLSSPQLWVAIKMLADITISLI